MKKTSFYYDSKLYKFRLVSNEPTLFGDREYSDKWDLLINAMYDDSRSDQVLKFKHPKHKDKVYIRHYIGDPSRGVALLTVGQFRDPLDYVYVKIVLKSLNYGEPYLVIIKAGQSLRNPHIMAEMVECAFNWALKGTGLSLVIEPWETDEKIMWYKDFSESLMYEIYRCKGEGLTLVGYEEALEYHHEIEAKKAKHQSKKKAIKSDRIEDYISKRVKNPNHLLEWLGGELKGKKFPMDIMRPIRFLIDKKWLNRLTFDSVDKRFHIKGHISLSSFNHYTNTAKDCFDYDDAYKEMENTVVDF